MRFFFPSALMRANLSPNSLETMRMTRVAVLISSKLMLPPGWIACLTSTVLDNWLHLLFVKWWSDILGHGCVSPTWWHWLESKGAESSQLNLLVSTTDQTISRSLHQRASLYANQPARQRSLRQAPKISNRLDNLRLMSPMDIVLLKVSDRSR